MQKYWLISVGSVGLLAGACAEAGVSSDAGADLPDVVDASVGDKVDARVITPMADAATFPGTPDAATLPGTPDAATTPTTPDAAVPGAPDAAGCTSPTTMALLSNGNFDLGPTVGWVEGSGAEPAFALVVETNDNDILDRPAEFPPAITPQSGSWGVWLGGYSAPFLGAATDTIHQDFAVPAGTTAISITGQRWFASEETGRFDFARMHLRTTGGGALETFTGPAGWDSLDVTTAWQAFSFAPTGNYAGQTIRLELEVDIDDSLNSNFFFDTLQVTATLCP